MERPMTRWISEKGIDELHFMHHWEVGSLDQYILQSYGHDLQQAFSSHTSTTALPITARNTSSCSSIEVESPEKLSKTRSWTSKQASNDSPTSILSFGSSDSPLTHMQLYEEFNMGDVKPKDLDVLIASGSKRRKENMAEKRAKRVSVGPRPPSYQDHIVAERKRREKLSQKFITLSSIIPNLKKIDKASVLGDAIQYVKQLQEKVKTLEEQATKKKPELAIVGKKSQLNPLEDQFIPEVEARQSDKSVLIKIHCENQKGVAVKLLFEIEKLHLTVTNASVMSFSESSLHLTVMAQVEEGFSVTMDDLVKKLNSAFRQSMI